MNDVAEMPYNEKRKLININDNAISGNGIKATDDNYINSENTYRGKYLMEISVPDNDNESNWSSRIFLTRVSRERDVKQKYASIYRNSIGVFCLWTNLESICDDRSQRNFELSLRADTARYIKLHSSSQLLIETRRKSCGEGSWQRPLLSRNRTNYVSSVLQTVINEHITHYLQ